ncbi:MAG: hypothetical protein NC299_02620 [Lachnospiraceae bacterium]|nr:hypothetical protein [Ruminococcus sp.]MCM1274244.1 hypothetical protein [Lachnospiraceae bacterium]
MRKRLLGAVFALAVLLSGCSGGGVTVNGSSVEIASAGAGISLPEGWEIFTGDDIYEVTYARNPEAYGSAEELKKDLEENGERYIVYAESPDEDALALFSSQPLESAELGALARTTHDSTVFEYRVNDYYTESSLSEENLDGVSGWLSEITVFEEAGAPALSQQREFMFERDGTVYSLRIFARGLIDEQAQMLSVYMI